MPTYSTTDLYKCGRLHTIEPTGLKVTLANLWRRARRLPAPVDPTTGPACTAVIYMIAPAEREHREGVADYRKDFASRKDAIRDTKRKLRRMSEKPALVELHTRERGVSEISHGHIVIGAIRREPLR